MEAKRLKKQMTFKGMDLVLEADAFVCDTCGFEAVTVESTREGSVLLPRHIAGKQGS
jgi:hypothetical protein